MQTCKYRHHLTALLEDEEIIIGALNIPCLTKTFYLTGITVVIFRTWYIYNNEIKHTTSNVNQLEVDDVVEENCDVAGFPDGGPLSNQNEDIEYRFLCFEYEDEIENNCTTMTLAAGEDKTWTMKNYIGLTLT